MTTATPTSQIAPDDVHAWLAAPGVGAHPFLVAERGDGTMLGWVRASSYRPHACYSGIAEFSVDVAEDARGRRVGVALMAVLIPACATAGLTKLAHLADLTREPVVARALRPPRRPRGGHVRETRAVRRRVGSSTACSATASSSSG